MIDNRTSKNTWSVGSIVKVGFMHLRVVSVRTERDDLPDIYTLENPKNGKRYEFIPHNGLTAI